MVTVRHGLFHPRCCTCHAWTIVWMLLLFTCSSLARDSFEAIPQTFEGHLKYGVYIEPTYVILTKPEGRQLAFETATDHFFFDVNCTYGTTENKEVVIREANLPSCCQMKILCQPAPSSKEFNVTVSSARPGEDYSILNTVRATSGETTHLDIFPPVRRSNHVRDASPPPCAVRPQKVDKDRYLWNLTFSAEPDELQLNVQMKPTYFRWFVRPVPGQPAISTSKECPTPLLPETTTTSTMPARTTTTTSPAHIKTKPFSRAKITTEPAQGRTTQASFPFPERHPTTTPRCPECLACEPSRASAFRWSQTSLPMIAFVVVKMSMSL